MNELNNAFQCCKIVLILASKSVLMAEVLYKLNVSIQVLQDLLFLNLQKRIYAGREEHIGSVWLSIGTCFLKHYRYDSAKIDEHSQFGFRRFILVKGKELLHGMLNSHRVNSCFLSNWQVEVLWLKKSLVDYCLVYVLVIEFNFTWMVEQVLIQILHYTVLDSFSI